jgi:hypothetical protein
MPRVVPCRASCHADSLAYLREENLDDVDHRVPPALPQPQPRPAEPTVRHSPTRRGMPRCRAGIAGLPPHVALQCSAVPHANAACPPRASKEAKRWTIAAAMPKRQRAPQEVALDDLQRARGVAEPLAEHQAGHERRGHAHLPKMVTRHATRIVHACAPEPHANMCVCARARVRLMRACW